MIGKLITAVAGGTIARSIGGVAAGPAGAVIGATVPVVLPRLARTLGPFGMIAVAAGSVVLGRYLERRHARRAAMKGFPPTEPQALLGAQASPRRLEAEVRG